MLPLLSARLAVFTILLASKHVVAPDRIITVANNCDYTIWPGLILSVGPKPAQPQGWEQPAGTSTSFPVQEGWGGRIWGRTGCDFTKAVPEYQMCDTGGCNGGLICADVGGTGVPPVTLAEFNIQADICHYDTSNVDGFNVPMSITTDTGSCPLSNCPYDLVKICPESLQYKNSAGKVVGCYTDCGATNNPEYCCTSGTQYGEPETCPKENIPNYPWWKKNCPIAYAYAYDEASKTALFTCTDVVEWIITFCPGSNLFEMVAVRQDGVTITQADGTLTPEGGTNKPTPLGQATTKNDGDPTPTPTPTTKKDGDIVTTPTANVTNNAPVQTTGEGGNNTALVTTATDGSTKTVTAPGATVTAPNDSSSTSADGDLILGMSSTTLIIIAVIVIVLIIIGIGVSVWFVNRKKKEATPEHKHKEVKSGSDSESGSDKKSKKSSDESESSDDDDNKK